MGVSDRVRIEGTDVLSDGWTRLDNVTFSWHRRDGNWQKQQREVYNRGDAVAILLYNPERRTIVLTKQFRLPAFLNGLDDVLIEVPAGLLEDAPPEDRVRAETEEETGYRIENVRRVFEAFMSPGSVKEKLYFFTAEYADENRVSDGGGHVHEGEDIETFETTMDEALAMISDGRIIDAKTIMLVQHAALHIFR